MDLRTKLAVLHFVHCDAALWAATLGMATTVPSLWHKIRCVRVQVCVYICVWVCVCALLCWAMFGIATTVPSLWHKIRCVRVRVCMCVCVVGLCLTCPLQPRAIKQGKEHVHAHVLLCVPVCYVPFLCTK